MILLTWMLSALKGACVGGGGGGSGAVRGEGNRKSLKTKTIKDTWCKVIHTTGACMCNISLHGNMWQINRPPSSTKPSSTEQRDLWLKCSGSVREQRNKCKRSMIYKHKKEQMQVINDLQTQGYTDTLSKRDPSSIDLLSVSSWKRLVAHLSGVC